MGPDGAIYIADWYNPIIQHGEVDFRDPRRDHTRGRIWRVTAKGRPLVPRPQLVGATDRGAARRAQGPRSTGPGSRRGACSRSGAEPRSSPSWPPGSARSIRSDPEAEHHRLEALWTYEAIDVARARAARASCSTRPTPRVRAAAVRVVPHWKDRLADPRGAAGRAGRRRGSAGPARGRAGPGRVPDLALGRAGPGGPRPAGRRVPRIRPVADGPPARAAMAAGGPGRPVRFRRPARSGWSIALHGGRHARGASSRSWPCSEREGPAGAGRERPDTDRDPGRSGRAGGGARPGAPGRLAARAATRGAARHCWRGRPSGARSSRRGTCRGSCRC